MVQKGERKPCPCDFPVGNTPLVCGKPEEDDDD